MVRTAVKSNKDLKAKIFYSSKTNDNLYFKDEIEKITKNDKRFEAVFRRT